MSVFNETNGRTVEGSATGAELIHGMLAQVTQLQTIVTSTGEAQLEETKKLVDVVEELDDTIRSEMKTLAKGIENLTKAVQEGMDCRDNAQTTKKAVSQGFADALVHNKNAFAQVFSKAMKTSGFAAAAGGGGSGGGGSGGGGGGGGSSPLPGGGSSGSRRSVNTTGGGLTIQRIDRMAAGMSIAVAGFQKMSHYANEFTKSFGISFGNIFKGVLSEEMIFISNMRKATSETLKYGEEFNKVSKEAIDIGKVAKETNFDRVVFQKIWEKERRKGFNLEIKSGQLEERGMKTQQRSVKNAMATANLLGMEAEQTSETFSRWNKELGLSNNSMTMIQDHMKHVARTSGVSGENMMRAAQNSEKFMKNMQRTGTLTAEAGANIIQNQVLFEKYGVGEEGGALMNALSSSKGFFAADPGMQALINRAARSSGMDMMEVRSGGAMRGGGNTKFMAGLMQTMQDQISGQLGGNVDLTKLTSTLNALEEVDPRKAQQLRTWMETQSFAGLGAGGIEQMAKAQREAAKTPEERMAEIDAKLASASTTEQRNALMRGKSDIMGAESRKKLGSYVGGLESGNGTVGGGISGDLNNILGQMQGAATEANVDMNSYLKESGFAGSEDVIRQLTSGSSAQVIEANERLREVMNKIEIETQASKDPIQATARDVREINERLKEASGGYLEKISTSMMQSLVWLSGISFGITSLLQLMQIMGGIRGGMRGMPTGGGGMPGGGIPGGPGGPRPGSGRTATGVPTTTTGGRTTAHSPRYGNIPVAPRLPPAPRGRFRRGLGGLMNYAPELIGAAMGGYAGYQASDGGVMGTLGGAALGGGVGHLGKRMFGGTAGAAAAGMNGMPGYGMDAMPVFVVNGGIGGGIGGMAGGVGGGMMNSVMTGMAVADVGMDAMAVKNAVTGGTSMMGGGAKAAGFLGKAGAIGGKVLPFLAPLLGGISGFLGAEDAGRGKVEGTLLGAATGGAHTGSMLSSTLGIEQGSAGDELLGIGTSALGGAATGAAIGSVIPVVGTAIGAAVGGVIGGGAEIYKVLTSENSPLVAAASDIGNSIVEGASSAVGAIGDGLSGAADSIGSFFSGLSLFEDGTGKIMNTGMAVLHKGEAVIPAEKLSEFQAMGSGAFASSGLNGMLSSAFDFVTNPLKSVASALGLGAFSSGEVGEAGIAGMGGGMFGNLAQTLATIFDTLTGSKQQSGDASAVNAGLFAKGNVGDTSTMYTDTFKNFISNGELNNVYAGAVSNMSSKSHGDLARSLYPTEDDDYANHTFNSYGAGQMLDNHSSSRASASSNFFTPEDAESYIAAQTMSSRPSGSSALIPGLDALLDWHTTVHERKLDEIIAELRLRNQMSLSEGSSLPPLNDDMPVMNNTTLKYSKQDKIRGYWSGLQTGAYSMQQNATGDFRGGNE